MYSCLLMEVLMVNKYCKCINYISNGFEKKWGDTKNLNQNYKSKKGHNSSFFLEKVMISCLLMEIMMRNKCWTFQSNISFGFERNWGGTNNLNPNSKSKKGNNS